MAKASKILSFLGQAQNKRTEMLRKNILWSIVIKAWNCVVQLILVPVTLGCLSQYEYGIWLTINSILIWIDSFDIGLGNGLRNQLTKSIAVGDMEGGRRQVSTTFLMLCIIILPVLLMIFLAINNADCYKFLNVDRAKTQDLDGILMVSAAMVGATFVFKFIGNIYQALQLPAVNNLIVALGQTLALVLIFCMSHIMDNISLFDVALLYAASPFVVYVLFYPVTFTKYAALRPSIREFDRHELKPLFGLGVKFFFVQVSGMVIFTTSNILISRLFSPMEVVPYQLANRYFGLTNIMFTLLSAPLWSATTDAFAKDDWLWISNTVKTMRKIMLGFCVILALMLTLAAPVYRLWIGDKVHVPFMLSMLMAIYMILVLYGTCYSNMLCGFGKIKLLTIVSVTQALIYIPLAMKLSSLLGVEGIVLSLVLTTSISAVTNKIQFDMICSHKATGLFDN